MDALHPTTVTASSFSAERKVAWAILLLLLGGCLVVLLPFVPALLWALVLCITLWPLYQRLLRLFRQRHTLTALVMSLAMIVVVLLPVVTVANKLAENVNDLTVTARQWMETGPPPPPAWLRTLPLVGATAADRWQTLTNDSGKLLEKSKEWLPVISAILLKVGLALSAGLLQIALSLFIMFFLLRNAESLRDRLRSAVARIAGKRGLHLLETAGDTIRGVVYGILGTALLQAVMGGLGFAVAGVPGSAILALLLFCLSVVPLGPALVFLPAAFCLFNQGSTGWGIFMIVWGLIVSSVDNFVKPWLISKGSNLPFLLIFFGVVGGALAFGLLGAFLGPTLLAVVFSLVQEWSMVRPARVTRTAQRP